MATLQRKCAIGFDSRSRLHLNSSNQIVCKYVYSACITTTTPDVRVLHDPWFTQGVYDGSWFHFPVVADPLALIGEVDLIYVSHIHPDHYDPAFLKRYFAEYGEKPILIANRTPNFLRAKMAADGLKPTVVVEDLVIGNTTISVFPHDTGSVSDVDSAIVVKYFDGARTHCVLNCNDIVFDDVMASRLKSAAGKIDVLFCGYTGAGPYPQTYFDPADPQLAGKAADKKEVFFERYRALTSIMRARINVPFAGKYLLGGRLADLNHLRGVADPVEVLAFDPRAIVLADQGGQVGTGETEGDALHLRTTPYGLVAMNARVAELRDETMAYERLINPQEIRQLPLKRLLIAAARSALVRSECESDYFFCIELPGDEIAIINANRAEPAAVRFQRSSAELPSPRSMLQIDPRHLFGLLTHVYHWNNAEVGSHITTRRVPDLFNRKAQSFLNFLTV